MQRTETVKESGPFGATGSGLKPMALDQIDEIKTLLLSRYPILVLDSRSRDRGEHILGRAARAANIRMLSWDPVDGLRGADGQFAYEGKLELVDALKFIENIPIRTVYDFRQLEHFMDDPKVIEMLQRVARHFHKIGSTLTVIGNGVKIPPSLQAKAAQVDLKPPSIAEIQQTIQSTLIALKREHTFTFELTKPQYAELARRFQGLTLAEIERILTKLVLEDSRLDTSDLKKLLDEKRRIFEDDGVVEFVDTHAGPLKLGGMQNLKGWLARRRAALTAREAEAFGLTPPKGLLLTGVQGCGKSLAARVIAHEWNLPLLKLDLGRIRDKYVGETEKNLRRAIEIAEHTAPCVLWLDEIEKGIQQDEMDGGLSKRLLAYLLTWMQERKSRVFLVATSNDIEGLPPELLRKGRFDEIFFIDLPTPGERREILTLHLESRGRSVADFDMDRLVEASDGCSGAEIEQGIVGALYRAFDSPEKKLTTPHIVEEFRSTQPLSVVMYEKVDALRRWAESRTVRAS
ncbi:MAG: AAA family ATPase [Deltaproteobacteria bacterium]|nr:AAA family ATPase [Deltaproteobacteria bacterium]